jgi:hypothetical protein
LTSATVWPLKTVLRWPPNTLGLCVAGTSVRTLRNVVLAGSYDSAVSLPSDGPVDGLQVGTAPNSPVTGQTESERQILGSIWCARIAFVEWANNGVQVLGGNAFMTLTSSCANGWRGYQAGGNGVLFCKGASAVGNGASGFQSEENSLVDASNSSSCGNTQQGYFAISGQLSAGNSFSIANKTSGYDCRYRGNLLIDNSLATLNNADGLRAIGGYVSFRNGAASLSNTNNDVAVDAAGVIDASNASSLGVVFIDHNSNSVLIDVDGDVVYSSQTFIENSTGGQIRLSITSIGDLLVSTDPAASGTFSTVLVVKPADGQIFPSLDGVPDFGRAANRWDTIFATTATINTSDANEKQQIRLLTETEKKVALKIKSLIKAFKFNDAVEKKGKKARIHFGVIAQEVKIAFESENLNPFDYSLFCYDEWADEYQEVLDKNGNPTGEFVLTTKAGARFGIRYEELLAFIISAL